MTRETDGRIMRCCIISSRQLSATSVCLCGLDSVAATAGTWTMHILVDLQSTSVLFVLLLIVVLASHHHIS